jgi:peroxiredoxin
MMLRNLAFAVLFLGLGRAAVAAEMANPPVGQAAPTFSVTGIDGKSYSLKSLKGKTVVLEWMNPHCPFSRAQYESKNTQSLEAKYRAKGVVWISVNSSAEGKEGYFASDAEASQYLQGEGAKPSTLVRDPDGNLGLSFGAKTTPHLFVIDKSGKLAYKGAMDDHPTTEADEIAKSHNWVSDALDSLLAGKAVGVAETRPYGCGVKYKD